MLSKTGRVCEAELLSWRERETEEIEWVGLTWVTRCTLTAEYDRKQNLRTAGKVTPRGRSSDGDEGNEEE